MRLFKWLIDIVKTRSTREERDTLYRYRVAMSEADRWLASYPEAEVLLEWISGVGEGHGRESIAQMRERFERARKP